MDKSKTLTILLILTVTTAIAGITYAHWADTINVTGTVNAGEQKVEITCHKCGTWGWSCLRKSYSTVTCTLTSDKQTLNVEWKNLWPYATLWVILEIKNTGAIPVDIEPPSTTFDPPEMREHFNTYTILYGPFNGNTPKIPDDENSDPPDCWCWCKPPEPVQLGPDQTLIICLCISFMPTDYCSLVGKTAQITIPLNYQQWNINP